MPIKTDAKNVQFSESEDKRIVSVFVQRTIAGSSDTTTFFFKPLKTTIPFLRGEDYPALVQAWDNDDDNIFDKL
ncbi:MAG: hypothetical protein JXB29_08475 [Sedimentisphaerales bacterium]|nr:hypothetical protein [Sedimentisphaerales bacterium]